MSIKELDWEFSKRGAEDVARHQKKIKESVKKNISDIISEESIITRKKGQTVKVPIKGIKDYHFKHTQAPNGDGETRGLGHGKGKPGDVIGRQRTSGRPGDGPGKGKGKPGEQVGEDYMEAEIQIEELIQMMMEDLCLPDLRQKEIAETVIRKGWTFDSIDKHGIRPNVDKKRTMREAITHSASCVSALIKATGRDKSDCQKAFNYCKGNYDKALTLLASDDNTEFEGEEDKLKPFITNDDVRYRTIKEDTDIHSNAVIIAMMDVSGSMSTNKKYIARSFFFWMTEFLKHKYEHVEIRFIAHTTEAKLVDEHEFFYKGESGGTACHSAYDMATSLVETTYPVDRWNVYAFHFSDGEDWDTERTGHAAKKLMDKGINMLGYGEIQDDYFGDATASLMGKFRSMFNLKSSVVRGGWNNTQNDEHESFTPSDSSIPFVGSILKDKTHVKDALKAFFSNTKEKV